MSKFSVLSDEIASVTAYNPAVSNLYTVEMYTGNASTQNIKEVTDYLKFHATKINFGTETLNLVRNKVTKKFSLSPSNESYRRQETLSITWREADDWRVRKYHENWINTLYDREKDCYNSVSREAIGSVYRTFKITLPSSQKTSSMVDNANCNVIVFTEVLPKTFGDLNLAWASKAEIISHKIDYYVGDWGWESSQGN